MSWKWIGAVLIIVACGSFGFSLAYKHLREEKMHLELIRMIDYMICEMQYRLSAIPTLCRNVSAQHSGVIGRVFLNLAVELENQILPDVEPCMHVAVMKSEPLPSSIKEILFQLGRNLGRFDLHGQIKELEEIRGYTVKKLSSLENSKDIRTRGYKTLGLCAGAALVILFI